MLLAVFCLRLACGMLACLLLLPRALIGPRFYRTHFLTALGLTTLATLFLREAAPGPLLGRPAGPAARRRPDLRRPARLGADGHAPGPLLPHRPRALDPPPPAPARRRRPRRLGPHC